MAARPAIPSDKSRAIKVTPRHRTSETDSPRKDWPCYETLERKKESFQYVVTTIHGSQV